MAAGYAEGGKTEVAIAIAAESVAAPRDLEDPHPAVDVAAEAVDGTLDGQI